MADVKEMNQNLGDKHWYIVNTYSQRERRVADNLKRTIAAYNLENYIFQVLVAEEEVTVEVANRKTGVKEPKKKMKNLYPGHIFVEMIMTDDVWYRVRNCPDVTGIAGSAGGGQKPTPISRDEMESVLKRIGMVDKEMYSRYKVGDLVKIIEGTFEGQEGTISSINEDTGACVVKTMFFGRETEVEVEFSEIDKI